MFPKRLKDNFFPRNFPKTTITSYHIRFPESLSNFREQVQYVLSKEILGQLTESEKEINEFLAQSPMPVMLYANMFINNWLNKHDEACKAIKRFMEFWDNWPKLYYDQRLYIFLFINFSYNFKQDDATFGRFRFGALDRRKSQSIQEVENLLKSLKSSTFSDYRNFLGVVLPPFEGITERDAIDWLTDVAEEHFPNDITFLPDTKLEIEAIFNQWNSKDLPKRIPMGSLAIMLRGILYEYTSDSNLRKQKSKLTKVFNHNKEGESIMTENDDRVPLWQSITAVAFGTSFIVVLLIIAIFIPYPTAFQIFIFRVTMSLAAGGVGAIVPGYTKLQFKNWLRAGGASALFVLVFLVNPPELITETPESSEPKQENVQDNSPN